VSILPPNFDYALAAINNWRRSFGMLRKRIIILALFAGSLADSVLRTPQGASRARVELMGNQWLAYSVWPRFYGNRLTNNKQKK
jgi:hypothetical protein